MRVKCRCCGQKFDIPNLDVLEMADRLRAGPRKIDYVPRIEPNGNVLIPGDEAARLRREEAVRRRLTAAVREDA